MPDKKLYLFTTFDRRDQELINKLRAEGKFVYHLRNYDEGDGFTIEHRVWVNNIGNLVTNWDILEDKDYLDCKDFFKLCVEVNATEVYKLKEVA